MCNSNSTVQQLKYRVLSGNAVAAVGGGSRFKANDSQKESLWRGEESKVKRQVNERGTTVSN